MMSALRKISLILTLSFVIAAAPATAEENPTKLPLFFYVFLHDDIPQAERENIAKDYFSWLRKDLESFTGRRVYLELIHNTAPLTGFRYQGEDLNTILADWTRQVDGYRGKNNLPLNIRSKYLLLTKSKINDYTLGIAGQKHFAGIASLGSYPAAAHEIGHMLGGTHEASEVLYKSGWWCETNLIPSRVNLRANCYHYSDKNKEAIAAYLSESP